MKLKKINFSKLFDNSRALKILSVVAACCIWYVVTSTIIPTRTLSIPNFPLTTATENAQLENLGLEVINSGDISAKVTVKGESRVVGNLGTDNIVVYPQFSDEIQGAGTYTATLKARKLQVNDSFEILEVSPATVELKLDRIVTKEFDLEADVKGLTAPEGFVAQNPVVSPSKISIKGPEQVLNQIDGKVKVEKTVNDSLESTVVYSDAQIVLYDKSGNRIAKDDTISFNTEDVKITVPVLKKATLPIKFEYKNVPSNFKTDLLHAFLSESTIDIAGPKSEIDKLTEIKIGYVDVRTITLNNTKFNFPITNTVLPESMENLSDFTSVDVSFDLSGFAEQVLTSNNIQVLNAPSDMDVSVLTSNIEGIRLIGQSADLEAIASEDIIVEADLKDRKVTAGNLTIPVRISVPGKPSVWAVGEYTAVVRIQPKS